MAIWHFRVGFAPQASVIKRYGTIPISLSENEMERYNFWSDFERQIELENYLTTIESECSSWSSEIRCWGTTDGSQWSVIYSDKKIEWVTTKIDVRDVLKDFLSKMVTVASKFDLLLLANETYIFEPDEKQLLKYLRDSTAARYLEEPGKTLESIPASPSQILNFDNNRGVS